ncbi:hypothetical protein Cgig2_024361 [Carnegiea gigantea]|uniref:Uncharacterized protein n=1 Tax=Carnegiea gigantea TaxID=171969 RepID=A0A9Q1JMD3_9CARY|nr:hypothetical protein Cgig2_024361 [Carnegiea gigantea]
MNTDLARLECEAVQNFNLKNEAMLSFLKQKAKAHYCIKTRIQQNRVYDIQDHQGGRVIGFDQVGTTFVRYYTSLLGTKSSATRDVEKNAYAKDLAVVGYKMQSSPIKKKVLNLLFTFLICATLPERNKRIHGDNDAGPGETEEGRLSRPLINKKSGCEEEPEKERGIQRTGI